MGQSVSPKFMKLWDCLAGNFKDETKYILNFQEREIVPSPYLVKQIQGTSYIYYILSGLWFRPFPPSQPETFWGQWPK